jgi:hypothetical protein
MKKSSHQSQPTDSDLLLCLFRAIAQADRGQGSSLLKSAPRLAAAQIATGAGAESATDYFLTEILHYIYAGDSALHIAAAAFDARLVNRFLKLGANVPRAIASARNRCTTRAIQITRIRSLKPKLCGVSSLPART